MYMYIDGVSCVCFLNFSFIEFLEFLLNSQFIINQSSACFLFFINRNIKNVLTDSLINYSLANLFRCIKYHRIALLYLFTFFLTVINYRWLYFKLITLRKIHYLSFVLFKFKRINNSKRAIQALNAINR